VADKATMVRTVYYDEEAGDFCTCEGNFWKTCRLRVINLLPCQETLITLVQLERKEVDPADNTVKSISPKLNNLKDALRHIEDKFKI